MMQKPSRTKIALIVGITVLLALNLATFIIAYPQTYTPSGGINPLAAPLAKDFSAYYMGAWRLWHNPSHIYSYGTLKDGEPVIRPHPEGYKYLPNFLLITSPFLTLNYHTALVAFDLVQLLLLPAMAYIIYKLLEGKHPAIPMAVMIVALLLPLPYPNWGFSLSYYWQWGEGQAKVFDIFLLLLSFYLGKQGKPIQSGIALAFGFFDPRFGLVALPLYVMYNRKNLKLATVSAVGTLAASNLMLLYPGMASNFLSMVFGSAVTTPLYFYALIPLCTLLALMIANFKELIAAFDYKGIYADFTGAKKPEQPQKNDS